MAGIHK